MKLEYIKNEIKRENGKIICRYNPECRCEKLECGRCGWNPAVAQARQKAFIEVAENG